MRLTAPEVEHLRTRLHPPTTDRSTLARLLQPFWNACLTLVPERVAPNLLTVLGSLAVAVPTALAMSWAPTWTEPVPAWLMALQIAGIFLFQTLDALDGKQARKTGSSSPLGSWLDHALDIATCQLMFIGGLITLGIGQGWHAWLMLAFIVVNNYLLHWESSHTKMLILGNGTSITDVQVTVMVVHALGIALPAGFFMAPLSTHIPALTGGAGADLTVAGVFVVVSTVGVGGLGAVASIVRARSTDVPLFESVRRAISVLVPILPTTAALFVIADHHAAVWLAGAALCVGVRSVGRVVLENLLQRPAVTVDGPGIVVAALAPLVVLAPAQALSTALAAFVFGVAAIGWFFVDTARSLAAALDEAIFTLPPATAPSP